MTKGSSKRSSSSTSGGGGTSGMTIGSDSTDRVGGGGAVLRLVEISVGATRLAGGVVAGRVGEFLGVEGGVDRVVRFGDVRSWDLDSRLRSGPLSVSKSESDPDFSQSTMARTPPPSNAIQSRVFLPEPPDPGGGLDGGVLLGVLAPGRFVSASYKPRTGSPSAIGVQYTIKMGRGIGSNTNARTFRCRAFDSDSEIRAA